MVMPRVISKDHIPNLLTHLQKSGLVYAPVEKNGEIIFGEIGNPTKILLSYNTTLLPPKVFLLPPEEELFKVTNGRIEEKKQDKQFAKGYEAGYRQLKDRKRREM